MENVEGKIALITGGASGIGRVLPKRLLRTHPEFRDGIKLRNDTLLRAIPDEPPNEKRHSVLKMFGTLLYNPIYEKQTTPCSFQRAVQ